MSRGRLLRSVNPQLWCGRECDCIIAAAIRGGTSSAGHAQPSPRCETPKVSRIDGRICRDDYHARPVCFVFPAALLQLLTQVVLTQFPTNGGASDSEDAPKIRLHQNPDRVPTKILRQLS